MRLHELVQDRNVAITNEESGHVLVLTPEGAVFNNWDTDNHLNMTVAFGMLFDDQWRLATNAETSDLYREPDLIMHLVWSDVPEPSHLKLVSG